MEINLQTKPNQEWSCKVSIHKKYFYEGKLGHSQVSSKNVSKSEGASRSKPLGPWTQQESEFFHFATITSASEVKDVIYLAQLAVLNPSTPHDAYQYRQGQAAPAEQYQVKFSPNVIRLNISASDLPNLSFYDLPGVINVSDVPEEEYLVDLVQNLVKEYITQKDCINLLAIPMTEDPANSSASKLIREAKAESRTIGCLTKPDRLQKAESLDQWIHILKGERFRLGYGYYVIKNDPNPEVEHKEARAAEACFFEQEIPWADALQEYAQRFGTKNLQTSLSQLLTAQIQKCLPNIKAQVQKRADTIQTELRALPEPLSGNLPAVIMGELMKFEIGLQSEIAGGSEICVFQRDFNSLAQDFRNQLAHMKPTAILRNASVQNASPHRALAARDSPAPSLIGTPTPVRQRPTINIDSEDELEVHTTGHKRGNISSHDETPRKLHCMGGAARSRTFVFTPKTFSLAEVRQIIQNTFIGLPNQVHPRVTEKMIRMSMEKWQEPMIRFLEDVKDLCEAMVLRVVHQVFTERQSTSFFNVLLNQCQAFLGRALSVQEQLSSRLLHIEQRKPKTLNDSAMSQAFEEARSLISNARRRVLAEALIDELEQRSGKLTSGPARLEKVNKVPDDRLPAETFGPELHVIAVSDYCHSILENSSNMRLGSQGLL